MKQASEMPKVALVGRPNVGKSTLFNRLIGTRKAITDPTPGVTRDPLSHKWYLPGGPVELVDTGGYQRQGETIDQLVTQKTLQKCQEADLIILLMDVMDVTQEDEDFIEQLRMFSAKVILAVNKVDSPARKDLIWNFHSYGFETVLGISAAHGLGVEELAQNVALRAFTRTQEDTPAHPELRLAILGKPNAGKSTLCNFLTDTENSIVSDIPGTTRDVIEGEFLFKGRKIKVLDTAGIRRKKKVNEDVEYYSVNRAIKTIQESDVVILVIDSTEGLSDQDKKIAALVVKEGKGIILALNKWDLGEDLPNRLTSYQDRIAFLFPVLGFAPVLPLSAKKGEGIKAILNMAFAIKGELERRIETGELNQRLREWMDDNPPPTVKGKSFKVKYITQVSAAPVRFVAFVNRPGLFPGFYAGYIENRIRKDLGFHHVPISLELRGSSKEKGEKS